MNGDNLGAPAPELLALAAALGPVPAPCQTTDPEIWFEDVPTAVLLCQGCHAGPECLALARTNDERHGVWSGVDMTRKRTTQTASPTRRTA